MRVMTAEYCRDMDGGELRRGDRAVCLALPERQPVLVRIMETFRDGSVKAYNGRIEAIVPGESCILEAHGN